MMKLFIVFVSVIAFCPVAFMATGGAIAQSATQDQQTDVTQSVCGLVRQLDKTVEQLRNIADLVLEQTDMQKDPELQEKGMETYAILIVQIEGSLEKRQELIYNLKAIRQTEDDPCHE